MAESYLVIATIVSILGYVSGYLAMVMVSQKKTRIKFIKRNWVGVIISAMMGLLYIFSLHQAVLK